MEENNNDKPSCFDSEEQWREFKRIWNFSLRGRKVNICHDCTGERRDKMASAGRCAHPETVFVEVDGEVIGINGDKWTTWLGAVSGKRGVLLSPPKREVRDAFIVKTYRENNMRSGGTPKRMKAQGPKKKKAA